MAGTSSVIAGTDGASGSAGTSGTSGAGGAGGTMAGAGGTFGTVGGTGGAVECPSAGDPIGTGIFSAALDVPAPQLREIASLDGSRLSGGGVLRSRPGGLLALGNRTFADVALSGDATWHDTADVYDVLAADLDADEDFEVVTIEELGPDLDAGMPEEDGGGFANRYALKVWERDGDDLTVRTEVLSTEDGRPDKYAMGDADGDGDLDLVTFDRGYVIVQRNDGALAFTRALASELVADQADGDWYTYAALLADRNDDAVSDLMVIASRYGEPSTTAALIFLGEGEGRFGAPHTTEVASFEPGQSVALGDVTGDGLADAVLDTTAIQNDELHWIESLDATSVAPARSLRDVGFRPQLVDVNGDGTLDIAVRSFEELVVHIALGAGAFERREHEVPIEGVRAFHVAPAVDSEPAQFYALYDVYCPTPCTSSCARCLFGACAD